MKCAGHSSIHVFLASAALLLPALALRPASATAASKYAGIYQSDSPKPGEPGPSFSVSLGTDGSATITQDCGKGATTSFGHWTDSGSQIVVTFDAAEGRPADPPMVFQPSRDGLQAVTWNHAAWGKTSPPPLKKESVNWHTRGKHHFL